MQNILLHEIPQNPISRLAPTPSGYLHLGNIYNFILIWSIVRKLNGKLILRIDDSDASRCRDEYLEDIFETLHWLGLDYDEGPKNAADFKMNFSQQNKLEVYRKKLDQAQLPSYLCECSRSQIKKLNLPVGHYPGTCREKNLMGNLNLRLKVEQEIILGDFILKDKNNIPSYQWISLIEDIENNCNLIVRGEDLLSSTQAQQYLAKLLPPNKFNEIFFIHHANIKIKNEKISKSTLSSSSPFSLKELRSSGVKNTQIWQWISEQFMNKDLKLTKLPKTSKDFLFLIDKKIELPINFKMNFIE